MTPPTVQFIPTPAATGLGDFIVEYGRIVTFFGSVENGVLIDNGSTVYNGWSFSNMSFYDAVKNGTWTDDGNGLLWNMGDATNYANWQSYIGTAGGRFDIYETGTTNLIFSLEWSGERQWTTNTRQYGLTSVDYTGSVAASNTRVDIYHVKA